MKAKERRGRHAKAQRKHAASLRAQKIPRREDIARAFLEAARRDVAVHRSVNIGRAEAGLWKRLFNGTVAVLAERGFDPQASIERLMRALRPVPGSPSEDGDEEDRAGAPGNETAISA
jgi:hypothetical protein